MDRDQIKKLLASCSNEDHSLLFEAGKQDSWWSRIRMSEAHSPMLDEIRREAEMLLQQQPPDLSYELFQIFGQSGSRLEYERAYFERRKRLNTFAMMSLLEPERMEFQDGLHQMMWSICNEYTWCLPAHLGTSPEVTSDMNFSLQDVSMSLKGSSSSIDLFAAETGFALSEIWQLTEHRLPRLLRNRVFQEVYRRIFWPYMHNGPFHWETATHNWSAVCAGSIGAAALHLMKDEDDLAAILERVLGSMDCYLEGFEEDGATTEGYGYWYYGFGFFTFFADLLKKRTAGSINLFNNEKVHQIALFQQKCFMSGSAVVNFSDSNPESHIHMGLTHYLNNIYPDMFIPEISLRTSYTEDHCNRWATAFRNIWWLSPEITGQSWEQATYYLNNAQWLISRQVNKQGITCFAAKGGHNAEPHNHNDVGHFIIHSHGETFLADIGCGMYTEGYFGPQRYTYLCNGSHGHSVPMINGQLQQEGAIHRAHVLNIAMNKDVEHVEFDLASAYSNVNLEKLIRSFTWRTTDNPALMLEDTYTFSLEPHTIVERFISFIPPEPSADCVVISGKNQRLLLSYDHKVLQPAVQKLEFTDHYGVCKKVYALDFTWSRPQKQCKLSFHFQFES
jgi:hypothetical protein